MKLWWMLIKFAAMRLLKVSRSQFVEIWEKSRDLDRATPALTADEKHEALCLWMQAEYHLPAKSELARRITQGVVWMRRLAAYFGL